MKMMKYRIFLLVISLLWMRTSFSQTQDVQPESVKQGQIQQILNNWRARSGIPSATLSILLPGHQYPVTFTSGTTIYAGGERTRPETLFQAGSITKSFTSTIILMLESQGKLNINDSITQYLPQYPRWQNVTIRELLNHTSGIFNYTEAGIFNEIRKETPQAEFTPAKIVNIALMHHDYFPPGRGWKYSNTNYVLAGMIIEKVTGQPVANVVNYYLRSGFKLNLVNTYYLSGLYRGDFISRMAHGYSTSGYDVTSDNMSWANTAGAIVTTTQDLLIWWKGLFQNNLLPQQQMDEMMSLVCVGNSPGCRSGENRPHVSNDAVGKGYGLGIIQTGYGSERVGTVWWHNGTTKGYEALVMWYPKSDIFMALTINRNPGYFMKPSTPIIQHVLSVLIPSAEWRIAHPKVQHHYYARVVKHFYRHHLGHHSHEHVNNAY